jgi:SHS2 domain-containing protein
MWVMHEYNECYLYFSMYSQETDPHIKKLWEEHLMMEIEHLHVAADMLKAHENRDAEEFLPNAFPHLTLFESNIDYVRDLLRTQIDLTAKGTEFVPVESLPEDHRYFEYQQMVNIDGNVPTQRVIDKHVAEYGKDYRLELRGPHPVERFREYEIASTS